MGKHGGSMTAAAISKRIKAKGLGRLRWYCQMCEKQCRDENGFKNHTQSPGHQRQLQVFSEDPAAFIARFSNTFRTEFLTVLRRRYGTNWVNANTVYQEYIKDREHLHMNATKWTTLSEFAKEMGREGRCHVEEREDGWWMSYIDRDAAEKGRKARDMDKYRVAEERHSEEVLQRQIEMAKQMAAKEHTDASEVLPLENVPEGPLSMEVKAKAKKKLDAVKEDENALTGIGIGTGGAGKRPKRRRSRFQDAPKVSALEELMRTEKVSEKLRGEHVSEPKQGNQKDEHTAPKAALPTETKNSEQEEPWLAKGIVVKVTNKEVGNGLFYKTKGKVVDVLDGYGARVRLFDTRTVLELDQEDLETVIPKPGGQILVLAGPHRGKKATVRRLNISTFSVDITLHNSGQDLCAVAYEVVSRLAE